MSTKAEQIAAAAESDINKTRDEVNCSGTHDWCAQYVSRVLNRCGIEEYDTIVTYLLDKLLASGKWVDKTGSDPARGDVMAFDRNHIVEERPLDHILIVTGFDGTTITYVDGNGGGSQKVEERTIAYSDPAVEKWIRYTGDSSFFTDKVIHDVQPEYQAPYYQSSYILSDTVGGVIICAGYANNDNYRAISGALDWANWLKDKKAIGFYVFTNMNSGSVSYSDMVSHFTGVFQPIADAIANKTLSADQLQLGFWLDMEDEGHPWGTAEQNFNQYKAFREACTNLNLPNTWGLYGSAFGDLPHFNNSDIANEPLWIAWWGATTAEVEALIEQNNWTQAYIHQYTDSLYPISGEAIDGDKMIKAIPISGSGGGGGSTVVESVEVSVIAPPRIFFSPNPGVFNGDSTLYNRNHAITISTDATDCDIYYTTDGSSPYEYVRTVGSETETYRLSSTAVKYTSPVTISTDTHFRVIAVPTGTESAIDELLAKGSGTFLYHFTPTAYSWSSERAAYSLQSSDKKVSYFEENRQAFLRYHAEETDEEILYKVVTSADIQADTDPQPDD